MSEVTVRLWAAAKHAAGVSEVKVPAGSSVAELRDGLVSTYGTELGQVLARCSVLVNGTQAGPEQVVASGDTVEFLPPFAGG